MMTVNEVSRLTGVSIRTLQYYDRIGLLHPAKYTEKGYRLYDDAALRKLQIILLFRQLQFPLKQIREILDSPHFDPVDALTQQIQLLELQREHLDNLILHARQIQKTGVIPMDFKAFDTKKIEEYTAEAKAKWGNTDAYREYEQRGKQDMGDALMEVFAEIGKVRHLNPASEEAQELVKKLQQFISGNYYTCTKQILQGLGQMYVADERFRQNIDCAGGAGTAEFVARAIEIYCK